MRFQRTLLLGLMVAAQAWVLLPSAAADQGAGDRASAWRWVFDRATIKGDVIAAAEGPAEARFLGEGRAAFVGDSPSALLLDGTDHSIEVPQPIEALRLPLAAMTVTAWAYLPEQRGACGLVAARDDDPQGNPRGFALTWQQDHCRFSIRVEGRAEPVVVEAACTSGQWHHIAARYDGREVVLFVDGVRQKEGQTAEGRIVHAEKGGVEMGLVREGPVSLPSRMLLHEIVIQDGALQDDEITDRFHRLSGKLPAPHRGTFSPRAVVHGPFAEFITADSIEVTWETNEPATTAFEFGVDVTSARRIGSDELTTSHRVLVDQVQPETIYRMRVAGVTRDGREILTEVYEFDSHFRYLPTRVAIEASPYADDAVAERYRRLARRMVEAAGTTRGYALVLGSRDGRLAYHLAQESDLQIVVLEKDPESVRRCRELLDRAGLYGARVSVHQQEGDTLEYGPYLANLIVSDRVLDGADAPGVFQDVYRMVRPAGGAIFLASWADQGRRSAVRRQWESWLGPDRIADAEEAFVDDETGLYWVCRRAKLPGAGEWTHQYGHPDNSACSKDDRVRGDLTVAWWGRPGARPMPDRGNRNPAPVSANGRLYVQGNRTLFGMDAYNGTILWSKQVPTMRRANMPRDGSNMAATDDRLYLAVGGYCVAIDGQSGRRMLDLPVVAPRSDHEYDWGFVACADRLLLGSAVKRGSQYVGDKGEWYENYDNAHVNRVASDNLFACDRYTGEVVWTYHGGLIMNSTITLSSGYAYFVESRSEAAKSAVSGRLLDELQQDQYLVAVDLETGQVHWQRPVDFSKCQFMTYLVFAQDTLLVTGSDQQRRFHTYAYDAASGTELWQHETDDKKGHHTGQLAHPTIVGDKVYFNKHTYQLRTGDVTGVEQFNWHGCGVMSASQHLIFSRYEFHGIYDPQTKKRTELLGIRSGCWLSLIPSGGLLLAPETSAGCSCGHALQTSIAYVPVDQGRSPRASR